MSTYKVTKSMRDLRKSVLELLLTKSFDHITVNEICNNAMVTRMTFYKYYNDKTDLLIDALDSYKDQIVEKLPFNDDINTIEKAMKFCKELISLVLDYSQENIELLKALKKNQLDDIIVNLCEESISNLLEEINKIKAFKYPVPLLTTFFYGGIANSLNYWLYHPNVLSRKEVDNAIDEILDSIPKYALIFK